jgi:hypothetical protein
VFDDTNFPVQEALLLEFLGAFFGFLLSGNLKNLTGFQPHVLEH